MAALPRFASKLALVTGGTGGIGRAIVARLYAEGATVFALDLSSAQTPSWSAFLAALPAPPSSPPTVARSKAPSLCQPSSSSLADTHPIWRAFACACKD